MITRSPTAAGIRRSTGVYNGARRFYIVPGTPSDRRSAQNVRSGIRRILKADGRITAELVAPPPPPPKLAQRVSDLSAWLRS